jgi:hypothetical protein
MHYLTEEEAAELYGSETRGATKKYPWGKWLQDGLVTPLVQGEDFDCTPETLRPQIYNAARRMGGKASVQFKQRADGKSVILIRFKLGGTTKLQREYALKKIEREHEHIRRVEEAAREEGYFNEDDPDFDLFPDKATQPAPVEVEKLSDEQKEARREEAEDIAQRIRNPIGPPS